MSVEKIRRLLKYDESFNKNVFWIVGIIAFLFSLVSTVSTIVEGLGYYADIATASCSVLLIVLLIITYHTHKYERMYVVLCIFLIVLLMPFNYFFCGGIKSGMPMYFVVSIIICSFSTGRKSRMLLSSCGIIIFISCFVLGYYIPELVVDISETSSYIDILITFIITATGISIIINLLLSEYTKSGEHLIQLNMELEERTRMDALTGLYSRKALFDFLDSEQFNSDNGLFLAIFDIDNFRSVNSNFGHDFGDEVLKCLGSIIGSSVKSMIGEVAARYGSEEFVYVISADDYQAAVRKADNIRIKFGSVEWKDKPGLHITVSGGITKCNGSEDNRAEQALKTADKYMLIAKAEGKNRIKRAGSGIVINNMVFRI